MALIKEVKGKQPVFGENIYLADNATIVANDAAVAFIIKFIVSSQSFQKTVSNNET